MRSRRAVSGRSEEHTSELQSHSDLHSFLHDALPIFVLHDVEGFEHNEIATMIGCSIGNSKSQLHKARIKLRELLRTTRAEKARSGRNAKRKSEQNEEPQSGIGEIGRAHV